ncbi:MAG: TRAP transporter small permease subunit [Reinekea sp.]|nr:TRAP transporter small permease subunit [Reinekea sp.]
MEIVSVLAQPLTRRYQQLNWIVRSIAYAMVCFTFIYLLNNYLNVWRDWPGVANYFFTSNEQADGAAVYAWLQLASYVLIFPYVIYRTKSTPDRLMIEDSQRWTRWSEYVIRAAFWAILIIGLMDGLISWMRVEDLLTVVFGDELGTNLGKATFRGTYVHYPLIAISLVLAYRFKTISVSWLALLVVFAEAWIVVARFIFSYEQTLMGDLVRFWYAGLFLFSAAFTLREEGHVRVDVLYAQRSIRYKAIVNTVGIFFLAFPLCWIILTMGMWEKNSILNSPLLNFEISQSSYGLFIKYIMAAYLVVFAVSMLLQFCSYLLKHVAILTGEVEASDDHHDDVAG